jgi:hypothetical protein
VTASRLSVLLKTDIEAPSYRNFGLATAVRQQRPPLPPVGLRAVGEQAKIAW